jgi:uncharacterized ferredoxin-like protein
MAVYEGYKAANEYMLDVAKACAAAAAKAPSLTGGLGLRMEILTDEDIEPMIQVLETLGKTSAFQLHDATAFRTYKEDGIAPPVLLLGVDATVPVMWNCGACGFPTCGAFLKYKKKNKGVGIAAYGPSCLWKLVDFGVACDYACACAAQHKAEARILGSFGPVSLFLGRLEGCSIVLALPIGPVGSNRWFDRTTWNKHLNYEQRMMVQLAGAPNLSMAFSGGGKPVLKTKPNWWQDPTFVKVEQDPAFVEAAADGMAEVYKKIMELTGVLDTESDE